MNRLTKFEKNPNSKFPYKLKDESLCTELDSIHKLGLIEDLMEKYNVEGLEELDKLLSMGTVCKEFSKRINCSLDVINKASQNGIWVKDKWQGIKHISPDELNISIRDDDVILQELYYEDLDSVMDTTGRRYYGSDYQKIWWLKEDKSE
jgi:hypothetical protein